MNPYEILLASALMGPTRMSATWAGRPQLQQDVFAHFLRQEARFYVLHGELARRAALRGVSLHQQALDSALVIQAIASAITLQRFCDMGREHEVLDWKAPAHREAANGEGIEGPGRGPAG